MKRKRVLIDCDPGIDDALALLFALASDRLKVEAITTVHGNADVGEDVSEAYVQLKSADSTATLFLCVIEHGTGQRSNYQKMVAEVLQLHVRIDNIIHSQFGKI